MTTIRPCGLHLLLRFTSIGTYLRIQLSLGSRGIELTVGFWAKDD